MKINKAEIVKTYGKNEQDTGSIEVQIALLTARISNLTEHLKNNKQDLHSTRGLNKMVATRKKLLNYLSEVDIERARKIKSQLGIRG
ncbi:MAG TPA: 30S ribosomal protein S15 [Candidatus Onthoplasma faecipullorum]|nr:30S ribosomal protein S15 [Candidatus Onthoplasma faecipullorum]